MTESTFVEPNGIGEIDVDPKIIKVSPETHEALRKRGVKGDTFDDIIKHLMKDSDELHRMKQRHG